MLIPSLSGGGAERVCINLLPYLSKYFKLTLALLEDHIVYDLNSDINIVSFSKRLNSQASHILNIPYHLFCLNKLIKQKRADVVLSILEQANIINILTKLMARQRTIVSQHVEPVSQYSGKGLLGKAIFNSSKMLYRYSDKIVCVSKGIKKIVHLHYHIDPDKIDVIYNPIERNFFCESKTNSFPKWLPGRFILHIGRMRLAHKAQDLLLRSFVQVFEKEKNVKLLLLGEGDDKDKIEKMATDLGIKDSVIFGGWQEDVASIMRKAEMLVLSSRYEGLPMVLVEAMACGCPVVATDCPTGPREILGDNEYGLLVPVEDSNALAAAMLRMLSDNSLRRYYAAQARKRAKDFDIKNIGGKYVKVIESIIEGGD